MENSANSQLERSKMHSFIESFMEKLYLIMRFNGKLVQIL